MDKSVAIHQFITEAGWADVTDASAVSFLAAGEYNENHLVRTRDGDSLVFRINHGSQLGLDDQISYEFKVLQSVASSGMTPKPFACEPNPGVPELGNGVLLMDFLPGEPLDYARDMAIAARIFAATHSVPVPDDLIMQADPVRDIVEESLTLLNRFDDHPLQAERERLLEYREEVLKLADDAAALFGDEPMVVANTEVNSGNFCIAEHGQDGRGGLVDWEKAVVTHRYQDLGHFLVPTTTLWKSDHRYSEQDKTDFLRLYRDASNCAISMETLQHGTYILERTILLRAMSWCHMAWYEYTQQDRTLSNADTFNKISKYLDEMECFLK